MRSGFLATLHVSVWLPQSCPPVLCVSSETPGSQLDQATIAAPKDIMTML